jgi:hemerythrin-like metal-binding protein
MERISWDQSFSVGVAELDKQHKEIVKTINLLISSFDAQARSEAISEALTRLTKYAAEHFETEERLLAEHRYPELSSQKGDHKEYRKKVVAFCVDAMSDHLSISNELLRYLRDWWVNHILEKDMKYRSFFMERGVK